MFVLTISTLGFNRATERERSTYRCLISNIDKQTGSPLAVQSRPSWAVCLSLKFPASQHPNIPASQHPNIPTSQHPSSNPSAGLSSISFLIAALHLPVGRLVTCWAKRLTNANANNYTSSDISWMQLWFELISAAPPPSTSPTSLSPPSSLWAAKEMAMKMFTGSRFFRGKNISSLAQNIFIWLTVDLVPLEVAGWRPRHKWKQNPYSNRSLHKPSTRIQVGLPPILLPRFPHPKSGLARTWTWSAEPDACK